MPLRRVICALLLFGVVQLARQQQPQQQQHGCRDDRAAFGGAALDCEHSLQRPYTGAAPPLLGDGGGAPARADASASAAHGHARSSTLALGATDAVPWPQRWAACERCGLLNARHLSNSTDVAHTDRVDEPLRSNRRSSAVLLFDPHGAIAPRPRLAAAAGQ